MSGELRTSWQNYIGGQWCDAADGRCITTEDPATATPLAQVARAGSAEVERAVAAARECVRSRALIDMRPALRARLIAALAADLRAHAGELARAICLDAGKPLFEAEDEAEGTARYFEYYAGMADKLEGRYIPLGDGYVDYTVPTPFGVSAHVIPWNFPAEMIARSLAPALAAGNAVVVKSPELDPVPACLVAEACERVGFPAGAVNVICGTGEEAGAALVAHPGVDHIVFTGSVPTGRSILHAAAERVVPCVMELGGKSPAIVFPDADLDALVDSVRWGIYLNAGQVCNALSRLVVHREVHDEVVERVRAMSTALSVGPGIEGNQLTPLVSAAQLARVERMCLRATGDGARAVCGGQRLAESAGHFFPATVFDRVTAEMEIAREEVFGPVLAVLAFDTVDQALAIANGTDYGLSGGIFTRDIDRALWIAERVEAGQVYVNEWYAGGPETPFGGCRRSGYGREKGQDALAHYYEPRNIGVRIHAP